MVLVGATSINDDEVQVEVLSGLHSIARGDNGNSSNVLCLQPSLHCQGFLPLDRSTTKRLMIDQLKSAFISSLDS